MADSIETSIIEKVAEEKNLVFTPLDPPSFLNKVLTGTAFVTFSGLLIASFNAAKNLPDHWTPSHRLWNVAFGASYLGLSLVCAKYGYESTSITSADNKAKSGRNP